MYSETQIKHVHLEISSLCNAACPLCPRNFYGYPLNDGYVEHNMTLLEAQTIFSVKFLTQLNEIYINGNFGDAVMNPATIDIVQYFLESNPKLCISISTNGGARDAEFWQSLAHLGVQVIFCIDGLEDTHHLYRQNTLYSTVIRNAQTFIGAGGNATWKMIKFDHNLHQASTAKQLSQQMRFRDFKYIDHGRNQAPVFNKDKKLTHQIGKPSNTDFEILWKTRTTNEVLLEDIIPGRLPVPISCRVKKQKSVYVSSIGDVYPCCYLGFNPKTYGHGTYHQAANQQFKNIIKENNALEYSLDHCINWFNKIEKTWTIPTFEAGRLVICNDVCGQKE
jgi:MoaA/NifB/PqqE/SkfB family radical SAM enzyme